MTEHAGQGKPTMDHWVDVPPGRLLSKGHPAGDFLEAHAWTVVTEDEGFLRIEAHLPPHVVNPRGQLFGGFTPAYVDLVSLYVNRAGPDRLDPAVPRSWLTTINMRIDYFEPIVGPLFTIEATIEHRRGATSLVATRMFQGDVLATFALATMRETDPMPTP